MRTLSSCPRHAYYIMPYIDTKFITDAGNTHITRKVRFAALRLVYVRMLLQPFVAREDERRHL